MHKLLATSFKQIVVIVAQKSIIQVLCAGFMGVFFLGSKHLSGSLQSLPVVIRKLQYLRVT